jgi:hypothetical protein
MQAEIERRFDTGSDSAKTYQDKKRKKNANADFSSSRTDFSEEYKAFRDSFHE